VSLPFLSPVSLKLARISFPCTILTRKKRERKCNMNSLHVVCDAVGLLTVYAFEWSDCRAVWTDGLSFFVNVLHEEYHKIR